MKIGIVTITNGPDNYGNVLQNLAVQYILKYMGHKCETIQNYSYMEHRRNKFYLLPKIIITPRRALKSIRFLKFCKKTILYSPIIVTRSNVPGDNLTKRYDKFLCGSDQVWNPEYSFNQNWRVNLLQFAKSEQKIAFAASFGVDSLPESLVDVFRKGLADFRAISVRENSAVQIIENLFDGEVSPIQLLDPTMTLTGQEWTSYCRIVRRLNGKKYILKYVLGDSDENVQRCISKIEESCRESIRLVDLMDENSKFYASGPGEFLWLIKNASVILTDSFHAAVFSILFHKQFVVFRRSGNDNKSFGRLETLLSQFKLEKRIYKDSLYDCILEPIDFDYADLFLRMEKERTFDFLKSTL